MKIVLAVLLAALAIGLPLSVKAGPSSQRIPIAPTPSVAEGFRLGGGVPTGAMILTDSEVPPPGYAFTGLNLLSRTGSSQSWRTRSAMPTARFYHAAVAVDGQVYAIGGSSDTVGRLAVVERYVRGRSI